MTKQLEVQALSAGLVKVNHPCGTTTFMYHPKHEVGIEVQSVNAFSLGQTRYVCRPQLANPIHPVLGHKTRIERW